MARGLAGDEDSGGAIASVEGLMFLARGYFEAFTCLKNKFMIFDFEGELAFEDVEELACVAMRVTDFVCARWNEFFDDAEFWCFDEVPAVAVGSPLVVFGGF